MKRGSLALALAAALAAAGAQDPAAAAPMAAGAPARDVAGFEALTSSAEAQGDATAWLEKLASVIAKEPESRAASLALLRLSEARGDAMAPCATLGPALEKALAAKMTDHDARDRAAHALCEVRAQAGDWDGARAAEAARGTIRSWLVVGPFGFTQRALHDRIFPVETSQRARTLDPGQGFDGSAGTVYWRPVTIGPLGDGFTPVVHIRAQGGCAYGLAQLKAPKGTRAVVTISCGGSFKAWWNGAPVADLDRTEGWQPNRARFEVVFGEGFARLLVKDTSCGYEVGARIVAADGSGPIPGLQVASEGRIEPLEGDEGSAKALPAHAGAQGKSPYERAAAALELVELGLTAEALPALEAAATDEKGSAHLAFLLSRTLEDAEHLPQARRTNDARAWNEKALARDPKFLPALERKARFIETDGKPEDALRALRSLAREHPRCAAARRSAAFLARRQGWENEAVEEMQALVEGWPAAAAPRSLLADHYLGHENRPRALALYREALERDRGQTWTQERIAALLEEAGDLDGAEAIYKALAERYPDDIARLSSLADIARARGDVDRAVSLLSRASEMRGGEPGTLDRIAGILIEAGRKDEAVPVLERILALLPGQFQTRRLLATIRGREWDFAKPFDIDSTSSLGSFPGAEKYPKAHTICVLDHTVTRIQRDGSKTDIVHQTFKLLDDAGVERYHTVRLPGEILELRTIGTDGKVYEPIITDNTSEILMPKLEPGAVIDYRYRMVSSRRPTFQFDAGQFYFKDPDLSEPFERSQYVVIVEDGFDFETIVRNMPSKAEVTHKDGATIYKWEVRESDRIDQEPFMPGKDEILPSVQIVGRRTWDDVAEVYRERFLGRTKLTPELRAKADELTKGIEGDAAKARKIYDFTLDHVRGDQGGDEASEILVEKAGSRTTLIRALLDAAQVPSRWAMCATNPRLSEVEVWDPPRPELLKVPALVIEPRDGAPVWVLEGGRFLPYGLLPEGIQGAQAMLLSSSGGEMRVVPELPIEASASRQTLRIALDGRGGSISGRSEVLASNGYMFKDRVAMAPKAQLRTFVERQVNQLFRGAKVEKFDFPDVETPGVPFTLTYEAKAPDLVTPKGERLALKPGIAPLDLTRQLGGKADREQPFLMRMRQAQSESVEFDLGGAYEVDSVPANVLLNDRFATYSLTFEVKDGKIAVRRWFALLPARVERDEYGSVLRFCREVDAAERKWIELHERK